MTLLKALQSLCPNSEFIIRGDNIEWLDQNVAQPSKSEIDAEIARLQGEFSANEYQRSRASEYPSIVDQLDEIYHNGIDSWKAVIKKTKDKYPKG